VGSGVQREKREGEGGALGRAAAGLVWLVEELGRAGGGKS